MSQSDLQARPIYQRKRESVEAHLTIVCAALAVSRWIEDRTGWLDAPPHWASMQAARWHTQPSHTSLSGRWAGG